MDEVHLIPLASIRVAEKQKRKISRDKVERHLRYLEEGGGDAYPIELHALGDGTYTIAGNGRHRFFAYVLAGYSHVPAIVRASCTAHADNRVSTTRFF